MTRRRARFVGQFIEAVVWCVGFGAFIAGRSLLPVLPDGRVRRWLVRMVGEE